MTEISRAARNVLCALTLVGLLTACGGGDSSVATPSTPSGTSTPGDSSGGTANPPPASGSGDTSTPNPPPASGGGDTSTPTVIQGVATPSSVSVVTATNT